MIITITNISIQRRPLLLVIFATQNTDNSYYQLTPKCDYVHYKIQKGFILCTGVLNVGFRLMLIKANLIKISEGENIE